MKSSDELPEGFVRQQRAEANDYETTVQVLLTFSAFVVHDGKQARPGCHFGFGRRMTRTDGSDVHPDVAVEGENRFRCVGEVKGGFPKDQNLWRKELDQVAKYLDQLEGWWTALQDGDTIRVALLVHQSRSRAVGDYVKRQQGEEGFPNDPRFMVVEFNRSEQLDSYIFLRQEVGAEPTGSKILERLYNGVSIPIGKVLRTFPSIRFCDARPPMPFLLKELWTDVFHAMSVGVRYDPQHKAQPIPVNIRQITSELQLAYGSQALEHDERSAEFPKYSWIRDALEALVSLKLAIPGAGPDNYTVLFRRFKEDVLIKFIELLSAHGKQRQEMSGQLPLPLPPPN